MANPCAKPDHTHARRAGILCNDPQFQKFAAISSGFPGLCFASSAAAEYLRGQCQITSRRDLDTDDAGLDRFNQLRTEFDAWRGRIAAQR